MKSLEQIKMDEMKVVMIDPTEYERLKAIEKAAQDIFTHKVGTGDFHYGNVIEPDYLAALEKALKGNEK